MAVIDAPADRPRRRGPFYTQLYFQVLFAIFAGGLLGAMYPLTLMKDALDASGVPIIDEATGQIKQVPVHAWVRDYINPLGTGFVKLVKMIIAPVIFLTIVVGIANMRDLGKLGRVVFKAFAYFLFFSTLALIVGLVVGNVFQPGAGMVVDPATLTDPEQLKTLEGLQQQAKNLTIVGFLLDIIPGTFVGAFTSGNILQVLFLSVIVGISMAIVGDRAQPVLNVLTSLSAVVFKVVGILMRAAPIGAFGAFAYIISTQGLDAILDLIKLIGAVYLTSIVFIVVVLGLVAAWAGFSIFSLIQYLKEELFLVLGTSSSESALPALIEKMERAGCAPSVVGLVVPTGYSFNLDGTNIYLTMAALFIAQALNIPLTIGDQLILLAVGMLSSKGAAGVTGAGLITLIATLQILPTIPMAGVLIIIGIDRFLSECRALTNFIGNAVAAIVVSRWEGALDRDKLRAAMAGRPPPLAAQPVEQDPD
jgi:aerobic C4-dicarboxylate transport protein